jgi:hypothetical protein
MKICAATLGNEKVAKMDSKFGGKHAMQLSTVKA